MSKISSWSANILSPAPFLAAASQDETLDPSKWILDGCSRKCAREPLRRSLAEASAGDKTEDRHDGCARLDTLGAWLLKKCYGAHWSPAIPQPLSASLATMQV